jgi:hypothetical protein
MLEYYLHLLEQSGEILVTDSDGITLSDAAEARKEAIGLARDIVGHGGYTNRPGKSSLQM